MGAELHSRIGPGHATKGVESVPLPRKATLAVSPWIKEVCPVARQDTPHRVSVLAVNVEELGKDVVPVLLLAALEDW